MGENVWLLQQQINVSKGEEANIGKIRGTGELSVPERGPAQYVPALSHHCSWGSSALKTPEIEAAFGKVCATHGDMNAPTHPDPDSSGRMTSAEGLPSHGLGWKCP